MSAGDLRAAAAENKTGLGAADDRSHRGSSGLRRHAAFPSDGAIAVCAVAGDALVDCRIVVARGAAAVPDFERAPRRMAGTDQLQPLFVATVVCVWHASPGLVFCLFRAGAGLRFLLPGGTADVAVAGSQKEGAGDRGCSGF